ncbi:MAG: hypothetical protein K0R98_559 [Rickettsiaceae bacterium]|jgi:hypothetical protein|nr:hypothetical protein [Rickettsiaceae bacterium]
MSTQAHIISLNTKHKELELKLHEAYIHHLPTAELKKEKLKIKDEISSLEQQLTAMEDAKIAA